MRFGTVFHRFEKLVRERFHDESNLRFPAAGFCFAGLTAGGEKKWDQNQRDEGWDRREKGWGILHEMARMAENKRLRKSFSAL
jgi:hypothetical protein